MTFVVSNDAAAVIHVNSALMKVKGQAVPVNSSRNVLAGHQKNQRL